MNEQRKVTACRWVLALLVSVLLCGVDATTALADGMVIFPEVLGPGNLGVRYHYVTVSIEDGHAITQVEQEFYNPYDSSVFGQYLFPVPPDAILSDFQATVDGQVQQVVRQDVATTNLTLYNAVAQQRDPSLLQYVDWESLAFDLDLGPGESCRMILKYEEVLIPVGGMYRYRYTLSTERYSSQPLEQVSLAVDVTASSGLANVYSSSHLVTIERLGKNQAQVRWKAQNFLPTDDFELFFAPVEGGFGGGLLTGQRNGSDHLLFLFAPQEEPNPSGSLPKDIVFIIDHSGSMSGGKIEQARNALHFILGQLGEDDRFSIVDFSDHLKVFAPTLQPVEEGILADAWRYVDQLTADGGTDLDAALQAGLGIMADSERREAVKVVVFLTDGLPTAGITDEALIAQRVAQTNARLESRLHVFGVGYDVNTHLLDRLAADNGGTVTYVQPGENLETTLTGFYDRIAHPVLTDVQVEFEGLEAGELYPQATPDLFQGSSLLLTGRYRATSESVVVRVRGQAGAEEREYVYRFDLSQTGGHDFVPRLWATRRVGDLLDQVRVKGESPELIEAIQELGLGYGLVTPYTTFVVQGQADGAASLANMILYADQAALNRASGSTTIQARVQNQAYQDATQADLATGANIVNYAQNSLAQVPGADRNDPDQMLNVDLSLLQGQKNLADTITVEWIERNVGVDRVVEFGSEEYFALAQDPTIRPFLQSGLNVVFAQHGKVVLVQDAESLDVGRVHVIQISQPADENRARPSTTPLVLIGVLASIAALLGIWQVFHRRNRSMDGEWASERISE